MHLVLNTAWPWLWPDAYYHATLSYIYMLTVINVHLVVMRNRPYDRWLLKGVCMSAGIALIEVIDEVNKLVHIIDSDPEKFKFWEYYAAGLVILVCLTGVTRIKIIYLEIIVYTKYTLLLWNKITTVLKGLNLKKGKGN